MNVKVAIAHKYPLFRRGLSTLLLNPPASLVDSRHPSLTFTGEAGSTSALLEMLPQNTPDILLLDYGLTAAQSQNPLSAMNGLELVKWLAHHYPTLKIIVISPFRNPLLARQALKAGASAYLHRNAREKTLLLALNAVIRGEVYVEHTLMSAFFRGERMPGDGLSPREIDVLRLLCEGLSLVEIARRMHLSIKTVSAHKLRAMEKLSVSSDCQLYCLLTTARMFDIAI
ncbi:response regulator transcription factor [Pseudenterobacter timonensis]|uniref:Response regulator transcription factor n=1 Tax=Pseudenterobacter timonensis TaxID=1755099 RepID=A0AAE4ITB9_9ENTR|nr:response regulator transcription factor [Pseudenterobacter timonensis]MDR9889508.1 response regulator transcription factor [Pseudenterobacter timonensis]